MMLLLLFPQVSSENVCCQDHLVVAHYDNETVAMAVDVLYDPDCNSTGTNITIELPSITPGSLLINVLEHVGHETFNTFSLIYLHKLGYFLQSFNGVESTTECSWGFSTDPPISDGPIMPGLTPHSLDDIYVSNFGEKVTFSYIHLSQILEFHESIHWSDIDDVSFVITVTTLVYYCSDIYLAMFEITN